MHRTHMMASAARISYAADGAPAGQPTSQTASVAPEDGTLKRSIQMKMFATKADHSRIGMLAATLADPDGGGAANALFQGDGGAERLAIAKHGQTMGQLIGIIYTVQEKMGNLPDGSQKMSLLAIGEFEGTNYKTGEVFNSTAAYLPGYFAETAKAMLDQAAKASGGGSGMEFAVEIVLVPTGKPIPTAYEVRPLIKRRADHPLNRIKQEMQAAGRLRLPPPTPAPSLTIEGEILTVEAIDPEPDHEDDGDAGAGEGGADATSATQGDGEAAKGGKGDKAAK